MTASGEGFTSIEDIEVLSADDAFEVEDEPSVGGSSMPPPIEDEQLSEAIDGSLAGKLRAVGEQLRRQRTHDFAIPDTPIVLRARSFRDRKAYRQGVKTEAFIVRATAALFLRDEDTDELTPIPVWGMELARMLGFKVDNASELVRRVLDNPVRTEAFAGELINWMAGRAQEDERELGE